MTRFSILTILIALTVTPGCKTKLDNWITYKDKFDLGSISLPSAPKETIDTVVTSNYKLVHSSNISAFPNKDISPSAFGYDLVFPTNISEFDLFQMKKDSSIVNKLFYNMMKGAEYTTNSLIKDKLFFNYHNEPAVKFTLYNETDKQKSIGRIIIFDNYVLLTTATGIESKYSEEVEEAFFNTLKTDSGKSNRQQY